MTPARSALLAIAVTAFTAAGAVAQTVSLALDAVYEQRGPLYAVSAPIYATPEIALAAPISFVIGEPGLGQRHLPKENAFTAPAYYGEVVSRGIYPSLTASRCVTDLGYGRWEACD